MGSAPAAVAVTATFIRILCTLRRIFIPLRESRITTFACLPAPSFFDSVATTTVTLRAAPARLPATLFGTVTFARPLRSHGTRQRTVMPVFTSPFFDAVVVEG